MANCLRVTNVTGLSDTCILELLVVFCMVFTTRSVFLKRTEVFILSNILFLRLSHKVRCLNFPLPVFLSR